MDFNKFYTKFTFACGVPCSLLKGLIDDLVNDPNTQYIPATREDEAIGMAVGAYLAGEKPLVLMQNSGLGNSINALTSLVLLYGIKIQMVIGWRGLGEDSPAHSIMGKVMLDLLKAMGINEREESDRTNSRENGRQPCYILNRDDKQVFVFC